MTDSHHAHLHALSSTDEYQRRFRYRQSPRTSDNAGDVSIGQLGHMLDTLKDGVLYMRQIAKDPELPVTADTVYDHFNQSGLPDYLAALVSDPRTGSSFNRPDLGRVAEKKFQPDLASFMNELHAILRQQGLKIGKTFREPEDLKELIADHDGLIERYKQLLKDHPNPDSGKIDYKSIPAHLMADYAKAFTPVIDALYDALKKRPFIRIMLDDQPYDIPNTQPVNDRLEQTYPALVLFAFRTLGTGAADHHRRPAALEYEARQRTLIGAQSMITDTTQRLLELMQSQGCPIEKLDIDRGKLKKLIADYSGSFQKALQFCRTAECGYDLMYEDLERFITMGGGDPNKKSLDTPQDVALLLYAAERGFARHQCEEALREDLKRAANRIGACATMDDVFRQFAQNAQLGMTLTTARNAAAQHGMTYAHDILVSLENQ